MVKSKKFYIDCLIVVMIIVFAVFAVLHFNKQNINKNSIESSKSRLEEFYGTDFCVTAGSNCEFYKGTIGNKQAYLVYDLDSLFKGVSEEVIAFEGIYLYEDFSLVPRGLIISFHIEGEFLGAGDVPHGPDFVPSTNQPCNNNSKVLCGTWHYQADIYAPEEILPFYLEKTEPFNIFLQN